MSILDGDILMTGADNIDESVEIWMTLLNKVTLKPIDGEDTEETGNLNAQDLDSYFTPHAPDAAKPSNRPPPRLGANQTNGSDSAPVNSTQNNNNQNETNVVNAKVGASAVGDNITGGGAGPETTASNVGNTTTTTAAAASVPPLVHQRLLHPPHGRLQQLLHQQQHLLQSPQASTRPLTARSRRAGCGAHGRHCLTAEAAEAGGPSPRQQEATWPLTDLGGNSSVINCIFTILRQRELKHFGERANLESSDKHAIFEKGNIRDGFHPRIASASAFSNLSICGCIG